MTQQAKRHAIAKSITALIGTGALFLFFSEFYFFNAHAAAPLAEADVLGALEHTLTMLAFYMAFALPFLTALAWYQVQSLTGLFLAGCLYGWACEGAVIPQVYEAPPFSFLWTAISWHGLVDAMLAFWILPRALAQGPRATLVAAAALGGFWGYWVTWPAGTVEALAPQDAIRYFVTASLPFALGLICLAHAGEAVMSFPKRLGLIGSLCLLPFAIVMGMAAPVAAAGLALLVLVTLWSLGLERRMHPAPGLTPTPHIRWHWGVLLLVPAIAAPVFLFATETQAPTSAEILLPLIAFGGGLVFLGALILRMVWARR